MSNTSSDAESENSFNETEQLNFDLPQEVDGLAPLLPQMFQEMFGNLFGGINFGNGSGTGAVESLRQYFGNAVANVGDDGDPMKLSEDYNPSKIDIAKMIWLLTSPASSFPCPKLPREIALNILRFAEYYPRTEVMSNESVVVRNANEAYLTSSAVKSISETFPIFKLEIVTKSRDQGWSGFPHAHNTYNESSSWFDLALERKSGTNECAWAEIDRCTLQYNLHAYRDLKSHTNVLDPSHPLVKKTQNGDRFVLYAAAMYPGWANFVSSARITISENWIA